MSERILIVNADDFGRSPGINAGVIKSFEQGIVTSASLMVRWDAPTREAASYAREHPSLGIGLHADLGEWVVTGGSWTAKYEVVPEDDADAIERELQNQLDTFRALVGRDPTHLDAHQHRHRHPPAARVFRAMAEHLGVPLRDRTAGIHYNGEFYGRAPDGRPIGNAISVARMQEILVSLQPGVTELGCHPGMASDDDSMYGLERELEVAVLCDPSVRAIVEREGILLRSFASL